MSGGVPLRRPQDQAPLRASASAVPDSSQRSREGNEKLRPSTIFCANGTCSHGRRLPNAFALTRPDHNFTLATKTTGSSLQKVKGNMGREEEQRNMEDIWFSAVGKNDAYKYLQGGCQEDGVRLFPVVPSDRTRGNGHKLKQGKFQLNMRKNFFPLRVMEPWHRLPREAVDSPFLEIFKTRLDKVLCSLLWVTLLWQGGWTG